MPAARRTLRQLSVLRLHRCESRCRDGGQETMTEILRIEESRYERLEQISWWQQATLRRAKILVAGAGALGNEILKHLALLGIGRVVVVDFDRIELSNLSRAIFFRAADAGSAKADVIAA